jgi:3-methyladenine DNA glycosylase AlkD
MCSETAVSAPDLVAARIDADLRALPDRSVATMRKERRRWSAMVRTHPAEDVLALALALFERFDHRWIAYELVLFHPSALKLVGPETVERLAGTMTSWGDVDQFGVLLAGPAWRAGRIGDGTVHAWARRPDRWWRRAALVATVPLNVRSQGGRGDPQRTLAVCEILLRDRDDMVTKAMSWALRELVVHDRAAVEAFLTAHDDLLAAHVKREVRNKLTTGHKSTPSRRTTAQ